MCGYNPLPSAQTIPQEVRLIVKRYKLTEKGLCISSTLESVHNSSLEAYKDWLTYCKDIGHHQMEVVRLHDQAILCHLEAYWAQSEVIH